MQIYVLSGFFPPKVLLSHTDNARIDNKYKMKFEETSKLKNEENEREINLCCLSSGVQSSSRSYSGEVDGMPSLSSCIKTSDPHYELYAQFQISNSRLIQIDERWWRINIISFITNAKKPWKCVEPIQFQRAIKSKWFRSIRRLPFFENISLCAWACVCVSICKQMNNKRIEFPEGKYCQHMVSYYA